ncbi:MAG: cupredoxin domain-containing protein, partial [Acidimicrobiia bacterium]
LATAVLPRTAAAVDGPSGGAGGPSADAGGTNRRPRFGLFLGALVGATLAAGAVLALRGGDAGSNLPTVVLTARHSKFTPARIAVEPGTTVRFVVRNVDPIAHEFIIGPQEVHDRHEQGTESYHPPKPGEVTIPADEEAETTYTFDAADSGRVVLFGCHLPGHWTYGMHGEVEVG